jgi:hypothetical protein
MGIQRSTTEIRELELKVQQYRVENQENGDTAEYKGIGIGSSENQDNGNTTEYSHGKLIVEEEL